MGVKLARREGRGFGERREGQLNRVQIDEQKITVSLHKKDREIQSSLRAGLSQAIFFFLFSNGRSSRRPAYYSLPSSPGLSALLFESCGKEKDSALQIAGNERRIMRTEVEGGREGGKGWVQERGSITREFRFDARSPGLVACAEIGSCHWN